MKTLIAILQLIPSIIAAVKAAEEFIPLPGQGQSKLDFILGVITDTYEDAKGLIPTITKIIARIVNLANVTGIFKKS
jgi:hypothetical protein